MSRLEPNAIDVERLSRTFGGRRRSVRALDDVSFSVREGEVVGLLGVNGAGKTTLAKILSTLLLPTHGRARIFGNDVVQETSRARACSSVVFGGDRGLYNRLSARENLEFFGMLAGVRQPVLRRRVAEALEEFDLAKLSAQSVETYSKGQRQRLQLAIGLLQRPRLLLLDEPTIGLDPDEAARLRGRIGALRDGGTTVLLTSHYLLDIEVLASRVILLTSGRKTLDASLKDFAAMAGYSTVLAVRISGASNFRAPHSSTFTVDSDRDKSGNTTLIIKLKTGDPAVLAEAMRWVESLPVIEMDVRRATLEEAFRIAVGSESNE